MGFEQIVRSILGQTSSGMMHFYQLLPLLLVINLFVLEFLMSGLDLSKLIYMTDSQEA